jgi:hypothetical protein
MINKLGRIQRELLQDLGREPGSKELAGNMDITPEKVLEIQQYAREPISLDQTIGDEGDSRLGDFIEDSQAVDAVNVSLTLLHDQLRSVLATLPERESRILQLRFGLTDGHPPTLDQISRPYGGDPGTRPVNRSPNDRQTTPHLPIRDAPRLLDIIVRIGVAAASGFCFVCGWFCFAVPRRRTYRRPARLYGGCSAEVVPALVTYVVGAPRAVVRNRLHPRKVFAAVHVGLFNIHHHPQRGPTTRHVRDGEIRVGGA